MGKSQLFRTKPSKKFIEKFITLFGLTDITDKRYFSRKNLIDLKTIEKINKLLPELKNYYIPCKARNYLSELNEKSVITVLRQLLKTIGYNVYSCEKYHKGTKYVAYVIKPLIEIPILQVPKKDSKDKKDSKATENIVVNFD